MRAEVLPIPVTRHLLLEPNVDDQTLRRWR